jgi:hypothetical protein
MNLDRKIFLLSIIIIFISICAAYSADYHQNNDNLPVNYHNNDETSSFGCCSIVLQIDGNHSMMSYRRDSNVTADVFIEKVNWHGIPAIKQYKTDYGYFNHVIITNDGWMIGLGGVDDGIDNEICENITATMISKDYSISKQGLKEIQKIKKKYGKGHVVIKAPNGNYGFATPTKLKTGTLTPGRYISIPNDYSVSRGGNISLEIPDKVKAMMELSQTDLYGLDRREIITYDYYVTDEGNNTDIYVSNEDGSFVGANYTDCIDNVCFNNTTIAGSDIPIAPGYKNIGSISFVEETTSADNLVILLFIVGFVFFVAILFFIVLRFVRFIRHGNRR